MEEQNVNTEQVIPQKKKSKVGTVVVSILIMILFIAIQGIVGSFYTVPMATSAMLEAGGDIEAGMAQYMEELASSDTLSILECVATAISLVIALIWYLAGYVKKDIKGSLTRVGQKLKNGYSIAFIFCFAIAFYGVAVLINYAMFTLMPSSGEFYSTMMEMSFGQNALIGGITAILLAPINEELIFRGILLRKNGAVFKMIPCIIIQALLFGLMHMNPAQSAFTFVLGLAYGYIGYKFDSVIPCIICHIINNGFAMLISGLDLNVLVYAISAVVCAVGTVFLFKKVDCMRKDNSQKTEL